jgi:hypothetical protein
VLLLWCFERSIAMEHLDYGHGDAVLGSHSAPMPDDVKTSVVSDTFFPRCPACVDLPQATYGDGFVD